MRNMAVFQGHNDILILLICVVLIICLSVYFNNREKNADKKRQKINELREEINKRIIPVMQKEDAGVPHAVKQSNDSGISGKEAAAAGTGFVMVSLYDVYASIDKHSEVIEVLEQRDPHVFFGLTETDLLMKIAGAEEGTIAAWINHYKGQEAENLALEYLRNQGMDAHLFDSLTHETNDIFVVCDNGETIEYSVKCGDVDYIKQCIESSDATHYVVNSEAYNSLMNQNLIEDYASRGIEIIDVGFSDESLTAIGTAAFSDISDSFDITDNIPWISAGLLLYKTGKNVKKLSNDEESLGEFTTNLAVDTLRIGAGGISAAVIGDLGMSVGTLIAPGIGTIVGGVAGAIGGAVASGKFMNHLKEQIKWGDIISAQEHFGELFMKGQAYYGFSNFVDEMYDMEYHTRLYEEEKQLCCRFKSQLDPYSKEEVTIQAVLTEQYCNYISEIVKTIEYVKCNIYGELKNFVYDIAPKVSDKKVKRTAERFAGELIIQNSEYFTLTDEEKVLIYKYNNQMKHTKEYPYRFSMKGDSIIASFAEKLYAQSCEMK